MKREKKSKEKRKKLRFGNINRLLLLLFFLTPICSISQTVENINLPLGESGGTMIGDIIYANGKIFTYSSDAISVYNANNNYIGNIPLNNWGKFNPFYFNLVMWPGEFNAMEYNLQNDMLYAMTPDLQIKVINVSDISQTWDISPYVQLQGEQTLQGLLQTLNGRIVMKYDSNHERLYILVSSRDPALNCPGDFHIRKNYFGIYDIDNQKEPGDQGYMTLRHGEIYNYDPPQYELIDQMNNFEFNTDQGQDYFYLTRLNRFEIWKIPDSGSVVLLHTEDVDTSYFNVFYKFGKMLYINNDSLHKIVIVPYMIPFESVNSTVGAIYVIDGDHTDIIVDENIKEFYAPSKMVLDVTYLESSNDLIMSYSPDEYIQYYDSVNHPEYDTVDPYSDIAVYQYDNTLDTFSFAGSYITNQPENTSVYDMNSSIQMLVVTPPDPNDDPNTVLIGKKDQIVKLVYDVGTEVYAHGQLLEAENNMFKNGTCGNGNSYIINSTMGKLEMFDNTGFAHSEIKTGHPVYHIAANQSGSNMYIYNKLNVENTGIYSYMAGDSATVTFLDVDKPIGACIHNPYQDDFLVSKTESGQAVIEIFDAATNANDAEISIANAQFAKEMFISKDGKLYIMANMRYPDTPQVFIYNALDYQYVDGPFAISDLSCNDAFISYVAYFNQGPDDVYMSIFPQELKHAPYNTEANRMYDFTPAVEGKLIRLNDEIIDQESIDLPGKVICPTREGFGGASQYDGKVFVIGKDLTVYNTVTMDTTIVGEHDFIDITYNAFHDKIFTFTNDSVEGCAENRNCKIWAIEIDNDTVVVSEYSIDSIPGQAATIFSNPYDGRVYLHQKVDNEKLGEVQVSLHSFDPSEASPTWTTTTLGITSFSPEYDQTNDPLRSLFYNITTPYINPYTNHIYLPNGGHSCVSKVEFTPVDQLTLGKGINWISIPRHDRPDPYDPEWTLIEDVFEQSDFTGGYSYLDLTHWHVYNSGEQMYRGWWVYPDWTFDPDIDDAKRTFSTRGYKLDLQQTVGNALNLTGTLEYPSTPIDLYGDNDNWVGYFLCESQSPFDAIPESVLDELTAIKAQGWCCVKQVEYHEGEPDYYWVCAVHEEDVILVYGDLVILTSDSELSFQWQGGGSPPSVLDKQETEHYQFNEQMDYISFMIDLDTSANPQEIGAFIGDSCVGASTVFVDDTIVLIPGYMEGMSGDVTFEEFYGSQKSHKPAITEYHVRNNSAGTWQKRTIHTSERQDHYFISFKHVDGPAGSDADQWFAIFPNPVGNMLNISYGIAEAAKVNISVFDGYGRRAATLMDADKPVGTHTMQWNLAGDNGTKLPKGLYIIKLKIDDNVMSRKVVVD